MASTVGAQRFCPARGERRGDSDSWADAWGRHECRGDQPFGDPSHGRWCYGALHRGGRGGGRHVVVMVAGAMSAGAFRPGWYRGRRPMSAWRRLLDASRLPHVPGSVRPGCPAR